MTYLLIRNIEPGLRRQIETLARKNHQSVSDAAKILIRRGLDASPEQRKLGTELLNLIPPEYRGDDLVFEYRGEMPKPPDFD